VDTQIVTIFIYTNTYIVYKYRLITSTQRSREYPKNTFTDANLVTHGSFLAIHDTTFVRTRYSEYDTICSTCLHTYPARAPKSVPCFD
jgi:hypothetical protein